jgi:hypothetical protein
MKLKQKVGHVTMTAEQAVREHEHLVGVLRRGGTRDLEAEAEKQEKELEEYVRKLKRKTRKYNRLDKREYGRDRR